MSTTLADPASRAWKRFPRFSVRGLIVLVLVIGAWLGWIVRSARIQRDAVAAIKNAGGNVRYDWERNNCEGIPGGKPCAPPWLVDLIGADYFGHVTGVAVSSPTPVTAATLAHVGRLSRLEMLGLSSSSVDDEGLANLKRLNELVYLDLGGTQVTDVGILHLSGLTKLRALGLAGTKVTDAGVKELQQALPSLTIAR
jgi:internalin A